MLRKSTPKINPTLYAHEKMQGFSLRDNAYNLHTYLHLCSNISHQDNFSFQKITALNSRYVQLLLKTTAEDKLCRSFWSFSKQLVFNNSVGYLCQQWQICKAVLSLLFSTAHTSLSTCNHIKSSSSQSWGPEHPELNLLPGQDIMFSRANFLYSNFCDSALSFSEI